MSLLCLTLLWVCLNPDAARSQIAQTCGVDHSKPARRIFANPDASLGWREYLDIKQVPRLENALGELAQLWIGHDGKFLISIQAPGEDFASYTDYCFDIAGRLIWLKFQLRTAWGWGFRQDGPVFKDKFAPRKSEFFDTKTDLPVSRPEQAASVPEALKPDLYTTESQLPFYSLLSKNH